MNTQLLYGETQPAPSLPSEPPAPRRPRPDPNTIMLCLAACMALQMTSYVMILPLFARRFTALGAGVAALGASEMAYALAATVAAPFMGALADRIGRRPIVLGSLAVYVLAFTGYLLAPSALVIIVLRGLAGALTAGLMPAATGMVADLAPEHRRAQWIGILGGGASFGWIAGPVLGGLLYDRAGFVIALLTAVGVALAALLAALLGLRETHVRAAQPGMPATVGAVSSLRSLRSALPVSLGSLTLLLSISFAVMFAWAFMEPRFMFYAYDDLRWSSSTLGLMMSVYGITMMLGEFGLSRLSDDLGRKPVIVAGLVLFSTQFLGLALSHNALLIAVAFAIAGLGNALFDPALSASLLDMTPAGYQSRILGIKSTVGSIGNIAGPALAVLFASLLPARGIFLASASAVVLMIFVAAAYPRGQGKTVLATGAHTSTRA